MTLGARAGEEMADMGESTAVHGVEVIVSPEDSDR
jgi:hypothetical protein